MKLRSPLSLEPVTLLQESLICANHEQALWAGIAQIRAQKRQQQETAQREAKEDQERARILRRRRQSQADYAKKQAKTAALSTALLYQTQKNVLGPDKVVAEPLSLFASQSHHLACTVGKSVKHGFFPHRLGFRTA